MRRPAGLAHRRDLVVERAPVAAEHMGAGDDDVDLARALADRVADLLEPQLERHEAGGKAGRDRGDRNARAFERLDGGRDHGRIDADRADRRRRVGQPERGEEVVAQRPPRLGAEAADALGRVVAGERGEIDAGQRLHQPGGLVFLLDRAAGRQGRGAALDRARVDADALEPVGARAARPDCADDCGPAGPCPSSGPWGASLLFAGGRSAAAWRDSGLRARAGKTFAPVRDCPYRAVKAPVHCLAPTDLFQGVRREKLSRHTLVNIFKT